MSNSKDFLNKLIDELGLDENTNLNSKLDDIGWDSLAVITSIAIFDEIYSITLDVEKLKECKTLQDIVNLSNC